MHLRFSLSVVIPNSRRPSVGGQGGGAITACLSAVSAPSSTPAVGPTSPAADALPPPPPTSAPSPPLSSRPAARRRLGTRAFLNLRRPSNRRLLAAAAEPAAATELALLRPALPTSPLRLPRSSPTRLLVACSGHLFSSLSPPWCLRLRRCGSAVRVSRRRARTLSVVEAFGSAAATLSCSRRPRSTVLLARTQQDVRLCLPSSCALPPHF